MRHQLDLITLPKDSAASNKVLTEVADASSMLDSAMDSRDTLVHFRAAFNSGWASLSTGMAFEKKLAWIKKKLANGSTTVVAASERVELDAAADSIGARNIAKTDSIANAVAAGDTAGDDADAALRGNGVADANTRDTDASTAAGEDNSSDRGVAAIKPEVRAREDSVKILLANMDNARIKYRSALLANGNDIDAKWNYELSLQHDKAGMGMNPNRNKEVDARGAKIGAEVGARTAAKLALVAATKASMSKPKMKEMVKAAAAAGAKVGAKAGAKARMEAMEAKKGANKADKEAAKAAEMAVKKAEETGASQQESSDENTPAKKTPTAGKKTDSQQKNRIKAAVGTKVPDDQPSPPPKNGKETPQKEDNQGKPGSNGQRGDAPKPGKPNSSGIPIPAPGPGDGDYGGQGKSDKYSKTKTKGKSYGSGEEEGDWSRAHFLDPNSAKDELPTIPPTDKFKLPPQEAQQILNSAGQRALKAPAGQPNIRQPRSVKTW